MTHSQDPQWGDAIREDLVYHTWQCDGYSCTVEITVQGLFKEALYEAKLKGWRFIKMSQKWAHYCPNCKPGFTR